LALGGLGAVEDLRGAPDVMLFGDNQKRPQIVEFQSHNLKLSKCVDQFIGHMSSGLWMIQGRSLPRTLNAAEKLTQLGLTAQIKG